MTKITPIADTLLIKPFPSEGVSIGGIFVPDSFKVRNQKAIVVAVGKGTKKNPMHFQPGESVYNIQNCGDEIIIDGVTHFLIKASYVLACEN